MLPRLNLLGRVVHALRPVLRPLVYAAVCTLGPLLLVSARLWMVVDRAATRRMLRRALACRKGLR